MSKRRYPYISERKKLRLWPPCLICDEPSRWVVTVQTSWFRSDDEVAYLCHQHQKAAEDELMAAWQKKEYANADKAKLPHQDHGGPHRVGHDHQQTPGPKEGQGGQ